MFANTAPFQAALRERAAARLETARETLYTDLTTRFCAEAHGIQVCLQEALRTAKTRRDFRTPLWTYNALHRSTPHGGWDFDTEDLETRVRVGTVSASVHSLLPSLFTRLGAFFGTHFTVSVQAAKVNRITADYLSAQYVLYLNYWVDPVRTEPPASPVSSLCDHDQAVCYCSHGDD